MGIQTESSQRVGQEASTHDNNAHTDNMAEGNWTSAPAVRDSWALLEEAISNAKQHN